MFLTERLEKCLRLSDFDESTWIAHESEGLFSRNMRKNTCFLVGGLIGFDYSSQGGRRNTDPKLIWGMSDYTFVSGRPKLTIQLVPSLHLRTPGPGFKIAGQKNSERQIHE